MADRELRRFYEGVQAIHQDTERKLRELDRWARVSFSLDVQSQVANGAVTDTLTLQHCPAYSRHHGVNLDYNLGSLPFGRERPHEEPWVERNGLFCPRSALGRVGTSLREVILQFETPPNIAREQWEKDASGVPVAVVLTRLSPGDAAFDPEVHVNYFHTITDAERVPLAPPKIFIYRSNDPASKALLNSLAR